MKTSNGKSRVKLVRYAQVLLQVTISCLSAQKGRQTYGMALNRDKQKPCQTHAAIPRP